MTSGAAADYAVAVRPRFEVARRVEKKRILDEFRETTGTHRKAAIRLLNREGGPKKGSGGGRQSRCDESGVSFPWQGATTLTDEDEAELSTDVDVGVAEEPSF